MRDAVPLYAVEHLLKVEFLHNYEGRLHGPVSTKSSKTWALSVLTPMNRLKCSTTTSPYMSTDAVTFARRTKECTLTVEGQHCEANMTELASISLF